MMQRTMRRALVARALFIAATLAQLSILPAHSGPREALLAIQRRVEQIQPDLVRSTVLIRSGGGTGSGVIISSDGLVLTAGHVVSGRARGRLTAVLSDGRSFQGELLGANRENDLAILKLTGAEDLPAVPLGDSSTLRRSQWVLATGHPLGQRPGRPPVLRAGRVLNLMGARDGGAIRRFSTDAPLISGDSGGPVYDLNGRVVGINSMITEAGRRMASIHVPVNLARAAIGAARRGETPESWNGPAEAFERALRESMDALRRGDLAAGVRFAREASQIDPDSAVARLVLARAMAANRQTAAAASALREAVDRGFNDSAALRKDSVLAPVLRRPDLARVLDELDACDSIPGIRKSDRSILQVAAVPAPVERGIVRILSSGNEVALGTVMSADGDVFSKASELPDGPLECVLADGRKVDAQRIAVDSEWDVALLKVRAPGLQPLPFEDAVAGAWTLSPDGSGAIATLGIVGVGEMPVRGRGITARPTSRAFMGVTLEPAEREELRALGLSQGVRLVVQPDFPAARAGLRTGDILVEADGQAVRDPDGLMDLMVGKKPGDTLSVRVARGEERLSLTINLTTRPAGVLGRGGLPEMLSGDISRMQGPFPRVMHHDAVLAPNQMGGPVLNAEGRCIGMNIARADRTSSYAISARDLRNIYGRLKSGADRS